MTRIRRLLGLSVLALIVALVIPAMVIGGLLLPVSDWLLSESRKWEGV